MINTVIIEQIHKLSYNSVTVKSDEDRVLIMRVYKYSGPNVQLRLRIEIENL